MDKQLHEQLLATTEELRALVAQCATEHVAALCAIHFLNTGNSPADEVRALLAPGRQVFFLLGLMLTTPEPEAPAEFGPEEWNKSVDLLNSLLDPYALMFWPSREELPNLTDQWREVREVAMPAFLHYLGATILASVEQIADRIRRYITPFDTEFRSAFGLSASEALEVTEWISDQLQRTADQLQKDTVEEKTARLALLDRAEQEGWNLERLRQEAQEDSYLVHYNTMMKGLQSFLKVERSAIADQFGQEVANSYWDCFLSRRGQVESFTYLTERNTAEERPLFEIADGVAFCSSSNALYAAVLRLGEQHLSSGESRDSFFRKRDKALEAEVEEKLRPIFGGAASFFADVLETETLQHEHDLVICWGRRIFVVEAKATPPVEPFRDPDKAFIRLKRAFHSDCGIQKAYEQANHLRRQLFDDGSIELYDNRGNRVFRAEAQDIDAVYCVCVTRDSFGPLAVDLSLLLDKEEGEAYPWAVNIVDLETLLDAWDYFGWGAERLCEYLDDRIRLNGKLFCEDELEIAGYFIHHGGLRSLVEVRGDMVHIIPEYSQVFDHIYLARQGGEPVEYAPTEPIMQDMRKMLAETTTSKPPTTAPLPVPGRKAKQGRNERCACGSGRKYKHCCGKYN